jgi:hypothetical protein
MPTTTRIIIKRPAIKEARLADNHLLLPGSLLSSHETIGYKR